MKDQEEDIMPKLLPQLNAEKYEVVDNVWTELASEIQRIRTLISAGSEMKPEDFNKVKTLSKQVRDYGEQYRRAITTQANDYKSKLNEEPEILIDSEKAVLVDKNLRSGEEIKADSDVIVTGRINSGATVETSKNAVILDAVDGDVRVEGDFIIIKTIKKGSVMLKGILLDKEMLDGELKMAFYKEGITYRGIK